MEKEIKPAYVSFDIANWLKEKGWNIKCKKYYNGSLLLTSKGSGLENCYKVYAPEQWQVIEWLRIKHGIWIVVNIGVPLGNKDMYYSNIIKFGHKNKYTGMVEHKSKFRSGFFDQPQKAYSAAFDYIKDNNLI